MWFWFFLHSAVKTASIRYPPVNRHHPYPINPIRMYADRFAIHHFHRPHSIDVPAVGLFRIIEKRKNKTANSNDQSPVCIVWGGVCETDGKCTLTLLIQLIVLSLQIIVARLVGLIFSLHECYVFGSFFQNLRSTRLQWSGGWKQRSESIASQ